MRQYNDHPPESDNTIEAQGFANIGNMEKRAHYENAIITTTTKFIVVGLTTVVVAILYYIIIIIRHVIRVVVVAVIGMKCGW